MSATASAPEEPHLMEFFVQECKGPCRVFGKWWVPSGPNGEYERVDSPDEWNRKVASGEQRLFPINEDLPSEMTVTPGDLTFMDMKEKDNDDNAVKT